jgi:serine/threonine protein kinase
MECNPVITNTTEWKMNSPTEFTRMKEGQITSYKVGNLLGKGSIGVVFSLIPLCGKKKWKAVKLIISNKDYYGNKIDIEVEYRISKKFPGQVGLSRPHKAFFNIETEIKVQLQTFGLKDIFPKGIIIMSKYDGTLKDLIPFMNSDEKKNAIWQIAQGLKQMHQQNIVHRDFHENNIFHREEKGKRSYVIADFDQAHELPQMMDRTKRQDVRFLSFVICCIFTNNRFADLRKTQYNVSSDWANLVEKMENTFNNPSLTMEEVMQEIKPLVLAKQKDELKPVNKIKKK